MKKRENKWEREKHILMEMEPDNGRRRTLSQKKKKKKKSRGSTSQLTKNGGKSSRDSKIEEILGHKR